MPTRKKHIESGKTRGYTLVELLVAIACASVMMSAIIGTLVFAADSIQRLNTTSEEVRMAQAAYDYIRSLDITALPDESAFKADGENLLHNGKTVLQSCGLTDIKFEERNSLILCRLIYSDKEYEFAAGTLS